QLLEALEGFGQDDLADIAYTLQVGREAMAHRMACMVSSIDQLRTLLQRHLGRSASNDALRGDGWYRGHARNAKGMVDLFTSDDDLQETLSVWMRRGKWARILTLWVDGLSVDWRALYGDTRPRRIALPTYPFARQRCWFDAPVRVAPAAPSLAESEAVVLMRQWEEAPAPVSLGVHPQGHAVIVHDERTEALARRLQLALGARLQDGEVELLKDGDALAAGEDWLSRCTTWIDVVGCGAASVPRSPHDWRWMSSLQRWLEHGPRAGVRVLGVTQALESLENPRVNMAGADRAGLYRMLQSEYGRLRSRHLDVEAADDHGSMVDCILAELCMDDAEPVICHRMGRRHRPVMVKEAMGPRPKAVDLGDHPVWWVTGGTRGIGLLCARHLVLRHGVRRLVLGGRDALPPRDSWATYLQSVPASDAMARKIRALQSLELLGAQVRTSVVSLHDERALGAEVDGVTREWGPVTGLIHAAGLIDLDHPAFVSKPMETIEKVMAPKVAGLDALLAVLGKQPLRAALLLSSVSAVIPGLAVGQSDYAVANSYMDYLAQSSSAAWPVLSVQWGNWKESGMGEVGTRAYAQTGLLSQTDEQGLALFDQMLASCLERDGRRQVMMPLVVNPQVFQPRDLTRGNRPAVMSDERSARRLDEGASSMPKAVITKNPEGLRAAILAWVRDLLATQLKMDASSVEVDVPLQDYGADSVLLAQVMRSIGKRLGDRPLDPSVLYEYPTIAGFSDWLLAHHGEELADALSPAQAVPQAAPEPLLEHDAPAPMARPRVSSRPTRSEEGADIAVVGMSCRFPGAEDLAGYWRLLSEGRSAIAPIPVDRQGLRGAGHHAALLKDLDWFDPAFFHLPESDARAMDPQALAVLEESLKLWYHAGYRPQDVKGQPIGVYLGGRSQHRPGAQVLAGAANPILAVGQNYLAANVSRHFDLRGPSLVVDTACSSSLVAMNLAVQALHSDEISMALVGGVNVLDVDGAITLFSQRGILSPDPAFHVFDSRAKGMVLGEGVGLVLLKRLDQALQDGDQVYAVLKGLAINNDGRTAGPSSPNPQTQREVMQTALAKSGHSPDDIQYIDANGSGSELMDLLELKSIEAVYRVSSRKPCALGSMKPNIGHPLCAEGMASFIKVVLMMHHRRWVPFLSGQQAMQHYDLASSPFQFHRLSEPWDGAHRVAAINCFADGGTNAHAILQGWEPHAGQVPRRGPITMPLLQRIDLRASDRPSLPIDQPSQSGLWGRFTSVTLADH
ncbi:MAG: beta-ketoacyl synthase N-terminal-like domain-containing protein, partial [Aquabacterium sp.]|uniref:type I polyketide synthase n=1 Tax=Aquabacterium sp. TaxID=1872578 RepID=UPI002719292C